MIYIITPAILEPNSIARDACKKPDCLESWKAVGMGRNLYYMDTLAASHGIVHLQEGRCGGSGS